MQKLLEKQNLLSYLESEDINKQLIAVAYAVEHLEENLKLFKEPDVLYQLNSQVKVYLLHRVKRQLFNYDNEVIGIKNDPSKLKYSLELILYMSKADYYSRILARNLKGWLLSLSQQHKALENKIKSITGQIKDAKRLLQSFSKELVKDYDEFNFGNFVNAWEILKIKRIFNELIVADQSKRSRVDGMTMMLTNDQERGCINIYSLHGQQKLSDFSSLASLGDEYIFKKMGWGKSISDPNIKNIKFLLTVNENLIIAIASHHIGIAAYERTTIDWQINSNDIVLWSAAYYPDYTQDAGLLAIGGEWHTGLTPVIFTFKLGKDNKLIPIQMNKLYLPDDWKGRRARFSRLKWDKKGGLWAVTGDKGELFHWENAVDNMPNFKPTTAKHLASNGNTQNALAILDDRVVCGGYDGVLRAFNFSGQLLWANVYDSPIRAITSAQDNGGKPCADLAIAVEKYGLVLCDKDGIQQGHLSMQKRPITNMESHIARKGGAQHHLIGMYTGEVRLVEEVPENWKPEDYLNSPELWINIEKQINQVSENKELCVKWCELNAAIAEPYRAIWAARQLIDKHNDFDNIVNLLTKKIKQRQDPVVLELRRGLLGLLGEYLDKLPVKFNKQIIDLCEDSRYGSFAQFLLKLPVLGKDKLRLLRKLFSTAHKKIITGDINVTSAVLQRLRLQKSDIPERDAEFFLRKILKDIQVFDIKVHIGYIEGLFAILFQQTKLAENGILHVFLAINDKYPRVANLLSTDKEAFKKFINWLNLYSRTLFGDLDYKLWIKICPELQKDSVNRTTLAEIIEKQIGRDEDRKLLKGFLSLFPHSEACCTQLIGEWEQYIGLIKELRRGSLAIINRLKNPNEVEKWITEQNPELYKPRVKLPLLCCFEQLLFQAWRSELNTLRNTLNLPKPSLVDCKKHSLSLQITSELEESLQRFFQTIKESAYDNGVFCEVEHVLGSQRYLKPIFCIGNGKQLKLDDLSSQFDEFVNDQRPSDLKYSKTEKFIIIPVIGTNLLANQEFYSQTDIPRKKYIPTFAFVFEADHDRLANQSDLKSILCVILGQINRHITAQYNKRFRKRYDILANIELKYFKNQYYDEEGLFHAALDLTDAKSGLLAMEFKEYNELQVVVSRGTENNYLHYQMLKLNSISNPVTRCWQNSKALFLPNYQKSQELNNFKILSQQANQTESHIYKWLSDENTASMIVLPVFAGFTNKKEGILLLSSPSPYFFTLERVAAVEHLLQKNRWAIEVERLKEFQKYMQNLFVHEIRSEIIPINHAVADLEKKFNKEKLLEIKRHSDKAKDFIDNLITVSGFDADKSSSFSDARSAINKFIQLNQKSIEQNQQRIIFDDGNEDLWHYAILLGDKNVYGRVVRVLLDNALKYGNKHADIYVSVHRVDKYWQLTITNPGHMAEIENRLKFEPFVHPSDKNPNSPATGTHLGLAASKRIVEAYGGQLFVDNTVKNGEERVQAILNWPLATGGK